MFLKYIGIGMDFLKLLYIDSIDYFANLFKSLIEPHGLLLIGVIILTCLIVKYFHLFPVFIITETVDSLIIQNLKSSKTATIVKYISEKDIRNYIKHNDNKRYSIKHPYFDKIKSYDLNKTIKVNPIDSDRTIVESPELTIVLINKAITQLSRVYWILRPKVIYHFLPRPFNFKLFEVEFMEKIIKYSGAAKGYLWMGDKIDSFNKLKRLKIDGKWLNNKYQ